MILLTGGTGLVGSQILFDLASAGNKIRALRRINSDMGAVDRLFSKSPALMDNIQWIEGDVTDIFSIDEAMTDIDIVYHSAAYISFRGSDRKEMMKVNAEGVANMVNLALKNNVKRFCHISSVAALGRNESVKIIDENSWWKTSSLNSNYALSKYGGEREVWRGIEEGLSAFVINPTIIIGPGNWQSGSTQMFSQVYKGLPYYTNGATGFVDVRDVAKAALMLMEKGVSNERYIINSENVSYRYVFDNIAENLGRKKPGILVTPFLGEIGWRVESIRRMFSKNKPMITKETARNGQEKWFYSNEKIKKETGIEFISVKKSIQDTCVYFFNEIKKYK